MFYNDIADVRRKILFLKNLSQLTNSEQMYSQLSFLEKF